MKSDDVLNKGGRKGTGRCTAEVRCVGLNISSAVWEENNMQEWVVKKRCWVLSVCDLYDIMPLRKDRGKMVSLVSAQLLRRVQLFAAP